MTTVESHHLEMSLFLQQSVSKEDIETLTKKISFSKRSIGQIEFKFPDTYANAPPLDIAKQVVVFYCPHRYIYILDEDEVSSEEDTCYCVHRVL